MLYLLSERLPIHAVFLRFSPQATHRFCRGAKKIEEFISSDDQNNSFRASVSDKTYVPLEAELISVSSLGVINIEPLADENKNAQKKFTNVRLKYNDLRNTYRWIQQFYIFGGDVQFKSVVDQTVDEIDSILDLIKNHGSMCFEQPSTCHEKWLTFKSAAASHVTIVSTNISDRLACVIPPILPIPNNVSLHHKRLTMIV